MARRGSAQPLEGCSRAERCRAWADAELAEAKRLYRGVTLLYVATLPIAVVALFVRDDVLAFCVAFLAFLIQVLAWATRNRAQERHSYGKQLDLRALLMHSLGESSEDAQELARFEAGVSEGGKKRVSAPRNPYASSAPPGMVRLRENLGNQLFSPRTSIGGLQAVASAFS